MSRRFRNISGPEIRRHRMAKDLSQDQLAARLQMAGLELDRVAVAKIESQIRSLLDWELAMISEVLGVEVGALLPGKKKVKEELPDLLRGSKDPN